MAGVGEGEADARENLPGVLHRQPLKLAQRLLSVLLGVQRHILIFPGPLGLAVLPLGLHLLDVGRIPEHDVTQRVGGGGGVDGPPEALGGQRRNHAGVVDVGMGEHHRVKRRGVERQRLVLIGIPPLLHAAVHQNVLAARRQ